MNESLIGYLDFVKLVIDSLKSTEIEYLIGGAFASWVWGEPRSTLDIDVVVNIPLESIGKLSRELEKRDMLVPAEIILRAITEDRADIPINAIHLYTGMKADIYPLRPGDELRRSALNRRKQVDLGSPIGSVYVHSPEDLIIYKTWYYSLSQQQKHARDIAAILASIGNDLDFTYVDTWIRQKGLTDVWEELLFQSRSRK